MQPVTMLPEEIQNFEPNAVNLFKYSEQHFPSSFAVAALPCAIIRECLKEALYRGPSLHRIEKCRGLGPRAIRLRFNGLIGVKRGYFGRPTWRFEQMCYLLLGSRQLDSI